MKSYADGIEEERMRGCLVARTMGREAGVLVAAITHLEALLEDRERTIEQFLLRTPWRSELPVAHTLGQQASELGAVIAHLEALMEDQERLHRLAVARTLGQQEDHPDAVIAHLEALMEDQQRTIEKAADGAEQAWLMLTRRNRPD